MPAFQRSRRRRRSAEPFGHSERAVSPSCLPIRMRSTNVPPAISRRSMGWLDTIALDTATLGTGEGQTPTDATDGRWRSAGAAEPGWRPPPPPLQGESEPGVRWRVPGARRVRCLSLGHGAQRGSHPFDKHTCRDETSRGVPHRALPSSGRRQRLSEAGEGAGTGCRHLLRRYLSGAAPRLAGGSCRASRSAPRHCARPRAARA